MKRRIRSYPKRPSLQRPSAAPAATAALQRASAAPGSTALVQRPSAAPDSVSLALQPHSKRLHSGDSNEHSLALPQRQLLQMGGVQRGESFGDEALRKIYIHAGEEEAAAALEDVHFARIGNERADGAARLARAQLKLAEAERAESKLQQAVESMQRELTHQASVRGELERELQQRERERASLITSIASERNSIDAAAKKYHKDASKCALDTDATTKSIAQAAQALEKMPPKLLEQMVAAAAADAVDGGGSGAAAAAASPPPSSSLSSAATAIDAMTRAPSPESAAIDAMTQRIADLNERSDAITARTDEAEAQYNAIFVAVPENLYAAVTETLHRAYDASLSDGGGAQRSIEVAAVE